MIAARLGQHGLAIRTPAVAMAIRRKLLLPILLVMSHLMMFLAARSGTAPDGFVSGAG
jgi:hypothetical protein